MLCIVAKSWRVGGGEGDKDEGGWVRGKGKKVGGGEGKGRKVGEERRGWSTIHNQLTLSHGNSRENPVLVSDHFCLKCMVLLQLALEEL